MTWNHQKTRWGYYELLVWKEGASPRERGDEWLYCVQWRTDTASPTIGRGSEKYEDPHDARKAALLHLASILPKAKSKLLLAEQDDLLWEPWFDQRKRPR